MKSCIHNDIISFFKSYLLHKIMISNRLHDNIVVLKNALSDNINRVKGYILSLYQI